MFHIAPIVADALSSRQPVLALESTIIAHGMPYPTNIEAALQMEQIARELGVTPATIAVLEGKICVGLSIEQIERIGSKNDQPMKKLSRRDLPVAIAMKQNGATTVATTMICAEHAGIHIFATGGIGGVHRRGEVTLDISADLQELARTNVAVVCSGAKAILDIGRTLEVLETLGVPVVGYGTERFPAFYYRDSGFGVDCAVHDPAGVAQLLDAKWRLGLNGGVVIANPVPANDALKSNEIELIIEQALLKAEKNAISGKEVTPYLLSEVARQSAGESLRCNTALVKDNARVGALVAVSYARILRSRE